MRPLQLYARASNYFHNYNASFTRKSHKDNRSYKFSVKGELYPEIKFVLFEGTVT